MRPLVFGHDKTVADWAFKHFSLKPSQYHMAIGVLGRDGTLQGAALFQEFNGNNVELGYFGPGTFTREMVGALADIALTGFSASRLTLRTSRKNKPMTRFLNRIGARHEGNCRRFYGPTDSSEHTAVQFVLFREDLERLSRKPKS